MSESFVIRKLIWENINLELNNGCRERERERERESHTVFYMVFVHWIPIHIQIIKYYCPHLSIIFFANFKLKSLSETASVPPRDFSPALFIWSSVACIIDTSACCTWLSGSKLFSWSVFLIFTWVYYSLVILRTCNIISF